MPSQQTEAVIAFRARLPAKLPQSHLVESTAIGPGLIWSVGQYAEFGGIRIPEGRVRSNIELYHLWDDFPRVQNAVKRHNSWEIWWGPDFSLLDFITKENKIEWIEAKTKCPLNSGKNLAMIAGQILKRFPVTMETLTQILKIPKTL